LKIKKLPLAGLKFWLVSGAILMIIGAFIPSRWLRIFTIAAYFAMYAMAWDLFTGYTGYVNFGPHAIIGLAAYFSVLCSYKGFHRGGIPEGFGLHWPISITIPIGIIVAVCIGFLACLPSLKLRGNYFCLFTLAFILAVDGIIITSPVTGGTRGLFGFPKLIEGELPNYYLSLILMILVGTILSLIAESKIGIILKAIRMNEDLVNASGINANRYKFIAFLISLIVWAMGGALYIHYLGSLSPESVFGITVLVTIIISTIIGGLGSIKGAMLGTYIFYFLTEGVRNVIPHTPTRLISVGTIGLIVFILMPEGIYGKVMKLAKKWREERI
jgi:branched-chain amino acid transport system permease protein